MKTFLISIAGMFVGGILLLVVLWFGLKFLIRRFLKKLASAIQSLGQGVPPFRVTLEKADDLAWNNTKAIDGIARARICFPPTGGTAVSPASKRRTPRMCTWNRKGRMKSMNRRKL